MADADLLLRAAAKLRERAYAATPGPWIADPAEIYSGTPATWVAESLNGDLPDAGAANSRYIALMHPPVGHGFANLLQLMSVYDSADQFPDRPLYDMALAVARMVLREVSDG